MNREALRFRCDVADTVQTVTLPEPVFRYRFKALNALPVILSFTSGLIPDLTLLEGAPSDDGFDPTGINGDSSQILGIAGVHTIPHSDWLDTGFVARPGTFYWSSRHVGAGFSCEVWLPASAATKNAYDAGDGLGGFGT